MKTIKQFLTTILLAVALAVPPACAIVAVSTTTGCSVIQPGNSSVVVRAEQMQQGSFDTVDAFLRFEKSNRDQLWAMNPEIKKVADQLRTKYPAANDSLIAAIKTYKSERSDANKSALERAMAVVEFLRTEAVKWHGISTTN